MSDYRVIIACALPQFRWGFRREAGIVSGANSCEASGQAWQGLYQTLADDEAIMLQNLAKHPTLDTSEAARFFAGWDEGENGCD